MVNMKGAEAVVSFSKLFGKKIVIKNRNQKAYRVKELDINLRKSRTRFEARLLHKAKLAGVSCPVVLCVEDFSLWLSFIKGKRPKMNAPLAKQAGEILAMLHNADIIHGDFTSANLILGVGQLAVGSKQLALGGRQLAVGSGLLVVGSSEQPTTKNPQPNNLKPTTQNQLYVIDFGLGFFSNDVEDKAVDVLTMLKSLDSEELKNGFLLGYRNYKKFSDVTKRMNVVESRVRYF